jgi:hypothetical protein
MSEKTMENCDMCGTKIEKGECSCGTWIPKEKMEGNQILKAIEEFHEMKMFSLTADAPHLGCAVVFFRGDYNDCKKVKKFICRMKKRPFYE